MNWTLIGEWMGAIAAALGLKTSFFVGLIGAVVSLAYLPEMKTKGQRAMTALGGACCANWCAPLVVSWFGVQSAGGEASIAFLIGLFGMSLAAAVIKIITDGSLWQVVKSRLPGGSA